MNWVVYDVDGVLIDVSESFDRVVKKSVEYLSNDFEGEISKQKVRNLREKEIFGDDFKLTEVFVIGLEIFGSPEGVIQNFIKGANIEWVRRNWGGNVDKVKLKKVFNTFYLGEKYEERLFDCEGLWKEERSIVKDELLRKIDKRYKTGVITGRDKLELNIAEKIISYEFNNSITRNDYLKPDPKALKELVGIDKGIFIGDNLSDQLLVDNYVSKYSGNFDFIKIGKDYDDVNSFLEELLDNKMLSFS